MQVYIHHHDDVQVYIHDLDKLVPLRRDQLLKLEEDDQEQQEEVQEEQAIVEEPVETENSSTEVNLTHALTP